MAQRVPIEVLIADQELSEIVEIGELDPNSLTSTQWKRFCHYQPMAFNGWEYIWLLRENDAIPDALADATDSSLHRLDPIETWASPVLRVQVRMGEIHS